MSFVINGRAIDKSFVSQLCDEYDQNDKRQTAKHVFTKMFEHAKAEVPNDLILEELTTNCNQAGYEFAMYGQIQPILDQYNLTPTISEKIINIRCNSAHSASVEYSDVIVVKNPDPDQFEQYKSGSKLEFTIKFRNGEVEYENSKVTLTIPEQLKDYKANSKSLLNDIKEYFTDADNAVVESLIANIGEGPKSSVVDQESLNSDKRSSFVMTPENSVFDLGNMVKLVKEAVDAKYVGALNTYIGVVQAGVTHVLPEEGLSVVEKVLEIVSEFAKEQGKVWSTYPTMFIVQNIYATRRYFEGYISQADYEKFISLRNTLHNTKSILSSNENGKNNNQPSSQKNLKPKSTGSQQLKKNVVDNGKNIMDNGEASTQKPISSSYEGDEMPNSDKNIESIEERLSSAIWDINFEEVKRLVEQSGDDITQPVLSKALEEANKTEAGKKDIRSKNQLIEIRKFLKERLDNIAGVAASSADGSVGDISATTSGHATSVDIDDEKEQAPGQSAEPESKDGQRNSSLSQSSESNSSFSLVNVTTKDEVDTDSSNGEYVKVSPVPSNGSSIEDIDKGGGVPTSESSSPQDTEPKTLEQTSDTQTNCMRPDNQSNIDDDIDDCGLSRLFLEGDDRDSHPEPTLSVVKKEAEQENDTNGNSKQPSDPKNTKGSKWLVIAASALAIAGIALGVAIAVHLEMLAVGIAVGTYCLVAAAVIYYCTPQSSVEDSEVEKVASEKSL